MLAEAWYGCPVTGILDLILAEPGGRRAQMLPAEMSKADIAWHARVHELSIWRKLNGRWPTMAATDPVERRLGSWLSAQRQGQKGQGTARWTEERERSLSSVCPGWSAARDEVWPRNLRALVEWRERSTDHGCWPKVTSSDPVEVRLARWLTRQRRAQRDNEQWSVEREESLDRACPGWNTGDEGVWLATLTELVAWRSSQENQDARPHSRLSDPHGRKLGAWLSVQRQAQRNGKWGWSSARQAALDSAIPGWDGSRADQWNSALESLVSWRAAQGSGRWPSATSTDTEERRVATWLRNQRRASQTQTKGWSDSRADKLDSHCPGWRGTLP